MIPRLSHARHRKPRASWRTHARHRKPPVLLAWLRLRFPALLAWLRFPALTVIAALALAAGFIPGLMTASAAPVTAATVLADRTTAIPALLDTTLITRARAAVARLAARTYTVRSGDSISSVAARHCGTAADWTGIYAASKTVIGSDPNLIRPGQQLTIRCAGTPVPGGPAARAVIAHAVRHAASGKTWGITYGYPNYCGDGDGDGWDVACSSRHHASGTATPVRRSVTATAYSGSGTYSYAGLEQLWVSAGGPSWAAAHAASIAECESGGRVDAYNPSGATGLWQILGSVVPGSLYNAYVNALNAVAKFRASGQTFAQWVCK